MAKTNALDLAIKKATELPEGAQDRVVSEILLRVETLAELRAAINIGLRELDAGAGKELDVEEVIDRARVEHERA